MFRVIYEELAVVEIHEMECTVQKSFEIFHLQCHRYATFKDEIEGRTQIFSVVYIYLDLFLTHLLKFSSVCCFLFKVCYSRPTC